MVTNDMITRRTMMNDKLKDKDGTQITCENCKGSKFSGLKIYGRSKQVTTTGAQLLNFNSGNITSRDGMTINISDDGGFFVDGTPQKPYTNMYNSILSLSAGDYYFFGGNYEVGTVYGQIVISKSDGTSLYIVNGKVTIDGTEKEINFTIQNGNNTDRIDHYTLYTMLNAGSTPLPWEPYTGGRPSPSPDYPQEIESAGMKWSTGANLLDTINATGTSTKSTWLIQQKGYSIAAQGTYAEKDSNAYKNIRIALDPAIVAGKKITASVEQAENDAGELPRGICDINYTKQSGKKTYWNNFGVNNPITITIPEDIVSVNCRIHIIENREETVEYGTYTTTVKGLMISIGDKVLPWEPYTGGVPKPYGDKIGVGVRGKNLLNYELLAQNEPRVYTLKNGELYVNFSNGIAWKDVPIYGILKKGIYTICGDVIEINNGLTNSSIAMSIGVDRSKTFKIEEDMVVKIKIGTGYTDYPRISYPMLVAGYAVTPYELYHAPQSMSISTPNGLPGITVSSGGNYTDADGQQWTCDEIDLARGVYVQRVWKGEFDGSDDERWEIYNNENYAGFYLNNVFAERLTMRNGIANTYKVDNSYIPIEAVWIGMGERAIYIKKSRFYDDTLSDKGLSNFKASLAAYPMVVMTYLDNPIETPLTADQIAAYKALHTYADSTTIIDNDAYAYMGVTYRRLRD